jgi:RNA polymerase sigma-70 factor (ECF subfamily)
MMTVAMYRTSAPPAPRVADPAEIDNDTLGRCAAGEPAAFKELVTRYERPVFAVLSRMLGRGAHVEDMAQETFLRAFRSIGRFDPHGPARLSTWLLTIAMRLAIDAKKRRRVATEPLDVDQATAADTPEQEGARRELGRRIARAVADLPLEQRAAFILAEMHGFTTDEVAAALEVPSATAKTRLFRAREKMRVALADVWKEGA